MAKKDRIGKALEKSLAHNISLDPVDKADRRAVSSTKTGAMLNVQVGNTTEAMTQLDKSRSKAKKNKNKQLVKTLDALQLSAAQGYLAGIERLRDLQAEG